MYRLENLPDEELLLITTYEEMAARPRFKVEVDPKSIKPMKILGGYPRLPGLVKCGLSTCHKKHYKGYLILTDCGLETNIGHDCGRKYFGVEFTSMVSDFERDSRISNYRAQIQAVREIAQNLLAQADNARRREMAQIGSGDNLKNCVVSCLATFTPNLSRERSAAMLPFLKSES